MNRRDVKSAEILRRAQTVLPGGVSSPVRAFGAVGGVPPFIVSGEGAEVNDTDGQRYLDFVGSWGPLILGHAHPEVVEAVKRASERGLTFGAPTPLEVELAERVVAAYPGIEQVRFVSSGTEATMSALRLARAATGRVGVLKFSGCYHGHADAFLVAAGSGAQTFGYPSSAGVPQTSQTLVAPLDDEPRLQEIFATHGETIAAVIVEPIPANCGLLVPRPEFLSTLRSLTTEHGALLIFDEVITGFRLGPGGAAAHFGVVPDLATFGKVIGGGMPVGAFAGRREVMELLAPKGPVYQAGTLSGNPVTMAAGLATLQVLERENAWPRLEALGQELETKLVPRLKDSTAPCRLVRAGSIFWLSLTDGEPPRAAESIPEETGARYRGLFHGLLNRGIQLAPSAYEVGFLSLAHQARHLDRFVAALEEVLENEYAAGTAEEP